MDAQGLAHGAVRAAAALAASLSLAACMVGPDHVPLSAAVDAPVGIPQEIAYADHTDRRWWLGFDDPVLTGLVADALSNSPDVRIAAARLDEARALAGEARSGLLPQIGAGAEAARERTSSNRPGAFEGEEPLTSWRYQAGFDAGWELDLFGGRRRALEAARAQRDARRGELGAVEVTVAAETVRAYLELRLLQERLAIAESAVATLERTADLTRQRRDLGEEIDAEVQRARAELMTRRAAVPEIRAELERTAHRLAILTGQQPQALLALVEDASSLPGYRILPEIAFPAAALAARPDVFAAERAVAAATADIGVATAELYPRITLMGNGGVISASTGDLFAADSLFGAVGPRVQLNLFSGGRVRSQIAAAGARAREAEARFDQTVLTALREIYDGLTTWRYAQERSQALLEARRAAETAARDIAARYEEGADDLLSVLDARRSAIDAADAALVVEAEALLALVSLFKATAGATIDADASETIQQRSTPAS